MTKLKLGMIGAGFIGQLAHFMNFIEVEQCEIRAVAEFKPELRKKVAARYNIPKTYATHTELLQDQEIDAVVVVTPRAFTGPIVLDSLKAGKHVLSEKPMAGNTQQGQLLLDAAAQHRVRYAVGYMKRYDEGVAFTKHILDETLKTGSLGTLLAVHSKCYMGNSYCNSYGHITTQETVENFLEPWPIAPPWMPETLQMKFGAYLNTYSHVTNLLRYLFGQSPKVEFVNLTGTASQLVVLGFENFLATLETGKMSHQDWSEEIVITFTDGEIQLCLPPALLRNVPAKVRVYKAGKVQEIVTPYFNWTWSFRRQAEAFVTDILQQKVMLNSAEEAFKDLQLVEKIWELELQRINPQNTGVKIAV